METFYCDYLLATPGHRTTLMALVPTAEKIHQECVRQTLPDLAVLMLEILKHIDKVLDINEDDWAAQMVSLGESISRFSVVFNRKTKETPPATCSMTKRLSL